MPNDSHSNGGTITLSPKTLIPIGVLFAVLIILVPAGVSWGVQWGRLQSDVGRLQTDLAKAQEATELHDIRIRRLETSAGKASNNETQSSSTERSMLTLQKRRVMQSDGISTNQHRTRDDASGSMDGTGVNSVEWASRYLHSTGKGIARSGTVSDDWPGLFGSGRE